MVEVILTANHRPACGGPQLVRYSSAGVYLALRKIGCDVRFVDHMSGHTTEKAVLPQDNAAEVCCYSVFFGNKSTAFRHMQAVRKLANAPKLIIAFGPFASEFPEEILSSGLADVVVIDDPEFVVPKIIQNLGPVDSFSSIPNIAYQARGQMVRTPKHSFPDLDEIPFIGPFLHEQKEPVVIMASRGCQYHCVFCDRNKLWGGGVRQRSLDNVIEEIRQLVEVHQVKLIKFIDEDLPADRQRFIALCEGMRRIKGHFHWVCSACVDSVNERVLRLMAYCRCSKIYYGVESASPQVLRKIGKRYGRQDIINSARWAQSAGVKVEVMLTTGNPGETDEDREMTLSVLKEIGPDVKVITNRIVIIPGTPLYRKGVREGWFTSRSFFESDELVYADEAVKVKTP